ncbi:MAG: TRAP transporter substrate-binding protein [Treponema sp.]|jgi:tripartite ATP-independent transporter DctP family solute receptor|nr:TRAP transporter substrate-binding protein [Treponema sp.]
MMKHTICITVLAAVLGLSLSVCSKQGSPDSGSSSQGTAPRTKARTFRLADNHPDGYPTVLGDLKFAELVKERSNGAILIEVYNNAVLGDERTAIEQTQMGDIQFIRVGTNPLASINTKMNVLSMPFLYRDTEHAFKVLDGPIGEEFLTSMIDNNLLGLCWFDAGVRNFYNAKVEIKTPEDMKGLKIRVQETALMMDLVKALGASPTPMAYEEIYAGIQNGIIDGAENNWPSYMTQSHNEVAKYYVVDGHTRAPEMILVNTQVWEKFSKDEQTLIKQAALEAAEYQRQEWLRQESDYEEQALAKGAVVTKLTSEQHQLFQDAVAGIYAQPGYNSYAELIKQIQETR